MLNYDSDEEENYRYQHYTPGGGRPDNCVSGGYSTIEKVYQRVRYSIINNLEEAFWYGSHWYIYNVTAYDSLFINPVEERKTNDNETKYYHKGLFYILKKEDIKKVKIDLREYVEIEINNKYLIKGNNLYTIHPIGNNKVVSRDVIDKMLWNFDSKLSCDSQEKDNYIIFKNITYKPTEEKSFYIMHLKITFNFSS